MVKAKEKNLHGITEGIIWKQLILFFTPIFLGSIFQQIYGITDAIIVGRYVGKEALGALNAMSQLTRLFLNLFEGISAGAAILIAQAWGAKDEKRVVDVIHTGVAFSIIGAIAMIAICIPSTPFFMNLMQIPGDMRSYSNIYIRIYFAGMAGTFGYNMGAAIMRSVGDSRRPFYYLLISSAVNIVLDLVLVAVIPLGVAGAGIATAVSQMLSAFLVLYMLSRSKEVYRLEWSKIKMNWKIVGEILKLGAPIGLTAAMYSISNILIQSTSNTLGTTIIAGWGIHMKIDTIIWTIMDALGITMSTFAAQNFGARKLDRVRKSVNTCLSLGCAIIIGVSTIMFVFSPNICGLFIRDPDVVSFGVWMDRFSAPFYVFYTFSEVLSGAIRGCGDTVKPMILTMIGTCIFRVIWVIVIKALHLVTYFWIAASYPASWMLSAFMFIIYYLIFRKKLYRQ